MIAFRDEALTWYRQMSVDQQIADDPSEVTMVADSRQLGDQIVRLSFDFARAEAEALAANRNSTQPQAQNAGAPEQESLLKAEDQTDQQLKEEESELSSLKQKLANATPRHRQLLQSQIAESQREVDLLKTRKDAIHSMIEFLAGTGGGTGGLRAEIDALAASLLATASTPAATSSAKGQANTNDTKAEAAARETAWSWELRRKRFRMTEAAPAQRARKTGTRRVGDAV